MRVAGRAAGLLAVAFALALPSSARAYDFVVHPNHTIEDRWHTNPPEISVGQALNEDCRYPLINVCLADNTDFAFGDLRVRTHAKRYEVAFGRPEEGAYLDDRMVQVELFILARHPRRGTLSEYALRIHSHGATIIIDRRRDVHVNGWFKISHPMTVAELDTLTLAGRIQAGHRPLAKNYVAYAAATLIKQPDLD